MYVVLLLLHKLRKTDPLREKYRRTLRTLICKNLFKESNTITNYKNRNQNTPNVKEKWISYLL